MASDYHLKIKDVEGEDTHEKHKGEIELLSWSWGESQPSHGVGTGAGAGKVSMQDFTFSMYTGKASAPLWLACAKGTHFGEAVLTCRKAGDKQIEYYVWTFTDIMITSFSLGGSGGGGGVPVETISFCFGEIEVVYNIQAKDGSPKAAGKGKYSLVESAAK